MFTTNQLERIAKIRKGYVLTELKACGNKPERFDVYAVLHAYSDFIVGLAVGLDLETKDVERELDNKYLGLHDLNHFIRYNSLSELYKAVKN